MMRRSRVLLAATTLVLALTGCGATETPAAAPSAKATSAAPTTPAVPVDGGTYDSPLVLIAGLEKAHITCAKYQAIANPIGAVARGNCYVGEEEYTVGIYASAADAREQPNAMGDMLKGVSDVDMVLGRNWTVGCPDEASANLVASILGGEVFHIAA